MKEKIDIKRRGIHNRKQKTVMKLSNVKLLKLHRQFAEPSIKKLVALLNDAKKWKDEHYRTSSDIEQKYKMCKKRSLITSTIPLN